MGGLLNGGKRELGVPDWIWQLILAIAVLALGPVVLIWGLARMKRRLQQLSVPPGDSGWTLEQVKRLYESGQLTDKQYKRLREEVAKALQKKGRVERSRRRSSHNAFL